MPSRDLRLNLGQRLKATLSDRDAKIRATEPGRHASRSPTRAISTRTRRLLLRGLGQARRSAGCTARSSPGWMTSTTIGAGTSGSRTGRIATHIVHKWPDECAQGGAPPPQIPWTSGPTCPDHLRRLLAGRGREDSTSTASLRAPIRPQMTAEQHDPHRGPAEGGPAAYRRPGSTSSASCTTCGSTAVPSAATRSSRSGRGSTAPWQVRRQARAQRTKAEVEAALPVVADDPGRTRPQETPGEASRRWSRRKPPSSRGARSPT